MSRNARVCSTYIVEYKPIGCSGQTDIDTLIDALMGCDVDGFDVEEDCDVIEIPKVMLDEFFEQIDDTQVIEWLEEANKNSEPTSEYIRIEIF